MMIVGGSFHTLTMENPNTIYLFADELMSNLQQIKQIVHAKWTQSNGNNSASATQEELTAEAERLLKKSQSKSFKNVSQVWKKLIF